MLHYQMFASMAELLRPKKRVKVENFLPSQLDTLRTRSQTELMKTNVVVFHVLFHSGCSATLITKTFAKHWNKTALKPIKWSNKAGCFKTKGNVI